VAATSGAEVIWKYASAIIETIPELGRIKRRDE